MVKNRPAVLSRFDRPKGIQTIPRRVAVQRLGQGPPAGTVQAVDLDGVLCKIAGQGELCPRRHLRRPVHLELHIGEAVPIFAEIDGQGGFLADVDGIIGEDCCSKAARQQQRGQQRGRASPNAFYFHRRHLIPFSYSSCRSFWGCSPAAK